VQQASEVARPCPVHVSDRTKKDGHPVRAEPVEAFLRRVEFDAGEDASPSDH